MNEYEVVVAIDFGTWGSGYAYAFTDDGVIYYRDKWPGQPMPYVKTLTQLLYSPDLNLKAWGYIMDPKNWTGKAGKKVL